ncbi:MAG: DUF2905 family protein [Rhizomicrobium sp.]
MRWLIYLVVILAGMLLFSQVVVLIGLDDMPGDITYKASETWTIHIPVLYSLGAVALAGLIFWAVKR